MVTSIWIEMNVCVWNAYIHVIFLFGLHQKQRKFCQNFMHKFELLRIKTSLTMAYVTCRLDHQKNKKIFYWEKHHHYYIEQWELLDANVDENDDPHTNREYRRCQAWYQGAIRYRLRL